MANKVIIIPEGADCFRTVIDGLNYHVAITDEKEFNNFCTENNIGYHEGARKDIVKSHLHIFTKDKTVFANFPVTTYIIQ